MYVFDLDICDIHLLQNCDRTSYNYHLLEQPCIGTLFGQQLYIYIGERDGRIAGTCQPS